MSSVALRRLRGKTKDAVNYGALSVGLLTGGIAYFNWRLKIRKEFVLGHGLTRLSGRAQNITPWKSQWLTWYRMPDQEYDAYYKFKPYYVIGQLDYSKEVLIPKDKTIDGETHKGFDVVNPLYCYDGGTVNAETLRPKDGIFDIGTDRAAIVVNRGWIPYELKDKRNRLWERNSRQLVKINGTFLKAKDIHDYKIPNNPSNNEWHNLAPEDLARYWELPNRTEIKQFYFQQLRMEDASSNIIQGNAAQYKWPMIKNKEEMIREVYGWLTHERYNKLAYYMLTPISAMSMWVFFLTF